ncbi:MAG: EFR1 family ferrodoxin, partial [Promethearchaeota archaeon]
IIIFGFPIFELNSPEIVQDFLKEYKKLQETRKEQKAFMGIFMFSTMGFASGNAFRKTFKYLKDEGFIYLGNIAVKMPGTDGLAMMDKNSSYVKKALARDFDHIPEVDKFIEKSIKPVITAILNEQKGAELEDVLKSFRKKPKLSILDSIFGWLFQLLYKALVKSMKKKYYADENCTKCGLCAKICPAHNITVDEDGVHFADKCILCLRCVHQCPMSAIQIGKMTLNKFRWKGPKGDFRPWKME